MPILKPIYAIELRMLHDACVRLYITSTGRYDLAYHEGQPGNDPEADEELLIRILEEAHNEWRSIRRRRRNKQLVTAQKLRFEDDDVPDTERNP